MGAVPAPLAYVPSELRAFHRDLLASRGYTSTTYPAIADVHAPLVARAATPAITRGYSKAACAAVDAGDVAALAAMLRSGELDPNAQGRGAHTLLHRACRYGQGGVVALLLAHGAWAHTSDSEGKTPLHDAAWVAGDPSWGVVEALLNQDESLLRAADRHGCTPLDYVRTPDAVTAWRAFLTAHADVWWHPAAGPGRSPSEWADKLWGRPRSAAEAGGGGGGEKSWGESGGASPSFAPGPAAAAAQGLHHHHHPHHATGHATAAAAAVGSAVAAGAQ